MEFVPVRSIKNLNKRLAIVQVVRKKKSEESYCVNYVSIKEVYLK